MLGFFIAALGVLFGVGSVQVRQFELAAAAEIASKLQGPAQVSVSTSLNGLAGVFGDVRRATIRASNFSTEELPLYTEPWRSTRGKIGELRLELSNFYLAGLRVESLEASIPNCCFDYGLALKKRMMRLSRSGSGTGTVRLRDHDLAGFILKKFKEIKSVEVEVRNDKVFVKGSGDFVLVRTNFEVIATLVSPDGTTLELANARIFFDGKPADELARKALLDTLNPVVDLHGDLKLFDAVKIRRISLSRGYVEASGDTKIPDSPYGPESIRAKASTRRQNSGFDLTNLLQGGLEGLP